MSDNKPAPDKPNHDHIEEFDLSNIQALLDAASPGEHMVRALIPESSEAFHISLEELLSNGNEDFVVTPDGTHIPTRGSSLAGNNNNASNLSIPGQSTNAQQQTYSQSHKIVTSLALPSSNNAASPQPVASSLPTTTSASASPSLITPSPVSQSSPQQSNVILTRSNSKQIGPSGSASSPPPPRTVTVFTSPKPGLALPGQGSPATVTSAPAGTHAAAPVRTSVQQQHLQHMQQQHLQQQQMAMTNNSPGNAPTLLDSIKATLPKDRQDKMDELLHQLQANELSAEGFLSQANGLLNQQQFQMLANLTKQDPPPIQHLPVGHPQLQSQHIMQSTNLTTSYMNNTATASPGRKRQADNSGQLMTPTGIGAVGTVVGAINPGLMRPPGVGTPSTPGGSDDRVDYETLTDVMQYAGVDLKEESDRILQDADVSMTSIPDGVDRSRMQDFLNLHILRDLVQKIASPYLISNIDPDFLSYLALATQDRLRSVIEQMSLASKHRVKSQSFDPPPLDDSTGQPLYKIIVHSDIKKQLLAIERVEREEERRRREALSDRQNRAAGGDGDGGGGGG
ncbi:transcription initiation factor TFIID component TAF4 family-domain-containing protein, partial [Endogone sp. FLAS-F59071]